MQNDRPFDLNIIKYFEGLFSEKQVLLAKRFIQQGKISLSFQKNHGFQYSILSGIVRDTSIYETKITFKVQEDSQFLLTTKCSCMDHKINPYCAHSASLFLIFLDQLDNKPKELSKFFSPEVPKGWEQQYYQGQKQFNSGQIISTEEFGSYLDGIGKNYFRPEENKVLESLKLYQFRLRDGKIINIPHPRPFNGQLQIHLYPTIPGEYACKEDIKFFYCFFTFEDQSGEQVQSFDHISIIESSYIFDWNNGVLFELHPELRKIVNNLKRKSPYIEIHQFLNIDQHLPLKVFYQNQAVTYDPIATHCKIYLNPDKGTHTHQLKICFFDYYKNHIPPAPLLVFFLHAIKKGIVLKKKNEVGDFYKDFFHLLHHFDAHMINRYDLVLQHGQEDVLLEKLELLFERESEVLINSVNKLANVYHNQQTMHLMRILYECFEHNTYRLTTYEENSVELILSIPSPLVFEQIGTLFHKVKQLHMEIYYNQSVVREWKHKIRLERLKNNLNWFELSLEITKEELEYVKNIHSKNSHVITNEGPMIISEEDKDLLHFIKKYQGMIKKDHKDDPSEKLSINISFPRSKIFELFELHKHHQSHILNSEELQLCERLLTLDKLPDCQLPELNLEDPRPYQVVGYSWLHFLYENRLGACLADDMGLGKTLQTIMFIKKVYEKIGSILIVCPVSILINWQNEFKKFTDLDVFIYYGQQRNTLKNQKIMITSYGIMKKEATTTFKDIQFDILILDEVQHLKNIKSLGAMAARKIKADFRICLTGTPLENNLTEFYNILDLSIPGIWGEIQNQKNRPDYDELSFARKMARPFILRRTKGQVLHDLPDKIDSYVYLNFSPEEHSIYKNKLLHIREKINNVLQQNRYGEILKGLLELRQLCLWQRHQEVFSTKLQFLMENLEQIMAEGHQTIVFSQFTSYLDIIQKRIQQVPWNYSRIDGGQTIMQRQRQVDQFQSGQNKIFLISLKAGGVGLNLTSASYVFLMDPWWNPAVEAQAIDRAHRIGQKNQLTVYRPIINDTVEEKVLKLQQKKKELFELVLDGEDENFFNGKLTMKDFEAFFE